MLMHACAAKCAPASAKRDFTALEMPEELVPFRIGVRYSALGRAALRRAMKARCPLMTSSG